MLFLKISSITIEIIIKIMAGQKIKNSTNVCSREVQLPLAALPRIKDRPRTNMENLIAKLKL